MKKTTNRILSLLLILVLLAGVMPAGVQADSFEYIYEANLFIHYPMGGQKPNMGSTIVGPKNYTVKHVHFFEVYNGQPGGKFLENEKFVAGKEYAAEISLVPKDGYEFSSHVEVYINGRYCEPYPYGEETLFTVFFTAAAGTVTVKFNTCDHGTPHAPVAVPRNGTLADAVADVSTLDPKDLDYEDFVMWALDPVAVPYSYNAFTYTDEVTEDTTLYAHWVPTVDTVDLYVQVPPNCFTTNVQKAIVTVPERADYSVETEYFYIGLSEGYLHYDLIYIQPFQKGVTYYSQATVHTHMAKKPPKVNLYGATVVSTQRWDDDRLNVIYKMTIPNTSSLSSAAAYVETPQAGQSASTNKPKITGLTPGLDMTISNGWYTNSSCSGSPFTGSFAPGSAYYARITVGGSNCAYSINANSLSLTLRGRNVTLISMSNAGTNTVSAVVRVVIPRKYQLTVDVPYVGGKIRCREENPYWGTTIDVTREAGPVLLEGRALPGFQFKMWYDANTYEVISRDQVYKLDLNSDRHIAASFVGRRFDDVDCWDYFYEPVMWAVTHNPVITSGTGNGQFSPNAPCTREQIMTFLWNAKNRPKPSSAASPFADVKPGDYYYDAVRWAVQNGITGGVGGGNFGVGMPCTREQAMTFLWKSAGSPGHHYASSPFGDVHKGDYFYNAVLWAAENGVTGGTGDGNFGVGMTCTRAQIITFLYKVYGPVG